MMGEVRNANKRLVAKSEWKRPFGRHRLRWKDNIKLCPKEIGLEVRRIHLAQDRDL
jgi:hypothetical protein